MGRFTVATHSNDSDRYAIRIQTVAVSGVTRIFAITINKAQGQSLQVCGLNLEIHGSQMDSCMACSRVGKLLIYLCTYQKNNKILCIQKQFNKQN